MYKNIIIIEFNSTTKSNSKAELDVLIKNNVLHENNYLII